MIAPRAVLPFIEFPAILRAHGFAVSPDQTVGFIEAIGLLGPGSIDDIRQAALAMLAIPKEREVEFEALFRAFFLGQTIAASATSPDEEEEVEAHEDRGGDREISQDEDEQDVGAQAATGERLGQRAFSAQDDRQVLRAFSRAAPGRLPRRLSYRYAGHRKGTKFDLRRTLRDAVRRDGEVFTLRELRRKTRQRKIVLLIDISGSMKERTDATLRFAHALAQAAERFEAFTLGTRLTRITPALGVANTERALSRVSRIVADFDGGTRIGEALLAFLRVPRFAGFARGAAVVILSDGLERGSPDAMIDAVHRLSRMAWRVDWLTPLAADPDFVPGTQALSQILPYLDSLSDGSRLDAICSHILNLARAA